MYLIFCILCSVCLYIRFGAFAVFGSVYWIRSLCSKTCTNFQSVLFLMFTVPCLLFILSCMPRMYIMSFIVSTWFLDSLFWFSPSGHIFLATHSWSCLSKYPWAQSLFHMSVCSDPNESIHDTFHFCYSGLKIFSITF